MKARRSLWLLLPLAAFLGMLLWTREKASWKPKSVTWRSLWRGDLGGGGRRELRWTDDGLWVLGEWSEVQGPRIDTGVIQRVGNAPVNIIHSIGMGGFNFADANNQHLVVPDFYDVVYPAGVRLWNLKPLRKSWQYDEKRFLSNGETPHYSYANPLALSPDSTRLAIGSQYYGSYEKQGIRKGIRPMGFILLDIAKKRTIARIEAADGAIKALRFSPDNRWLAAVADDGYAFVVDARNGKLVRTWQAHPCLAAWLAWSPDGRYIATGSNSFPPGEIVVSETFKIGWRGLHVVINGRTDGSLRLWEARTGRAITTPWTAGGDITGLDFSPDGKWLAVGSRRHARILAVPARNQPWRVLRDFLVPIPADSVITQEDFVSVAFSPDGSQLATSSPMGLTLRRVR